MQLFSELYPSQSPLRVTAPPRGASLTYNSRLSLSWERCRACRGGEGAFVQLFSELYPSQSPLRVTAPQSPTLLLSTATPLSHLAGDSSPLGEPLLKFYFLRFHNQFQRRQTFSISSQKFYFLRFHNQFQRRHNLLYLITKVLFLTFS